MASDNTKKGQKCNLSPVRNDIRSSIRKEAENTAIYYGKTIGEAARNQVDSAIENLRETAHHATTALKRYQSEVRMTQWKIIGASIAASVFFCLLTMFFLMPKPTLPLAPQQVRYLASGEALSELWPKLSKSEKERFNKLANKNGMIVHN